MTYHYSIDCEPSRVIVGRVPHNNLDHKLGLRFYPNMAPTTDFADELLRRAKNLYDKTKKNIIQSHIKHKNNAIKNQKIPLWRRKITVSYFSQKQTIKSQNYLFAPSIGMDFI